MELVLVAQVGGSIARTSLGFARCAPTPITNRLTSRIALRDITNPPYEVHISSRRSRGALPTIPGCVGSLSRECDEEEHGGRTGATQGMFAPLVELTVVIQAGCLSWGELCWRFTRVVPHTSTTTQRARTTTRRISIRRKFFTWAWLRCECYAA